MCVYIYIYIYICVCVCVCIYIYNLFQIIFPLGFYIILSRVPTMTFCILQGTLLYVLLLNEYGVISNIYWSFQFCPPNLLKFHWERCLSASASPVSIISRAPHSKAEGLEMFCFIMDVFYTSYLGIFLCIWWIGGEESSFSSLSLFFFFLLYNIYIHAEFSKNSCLL